LKAIWNLQEWSSEPVSMGMLAERVGLKASTVSGAIAKLADQGLVHHTRYGAVELTPTGKDLALAMVRRHRLIESFLVSILGYDWGEVHDEAEQLEHAVSELMIDRIDTVLGRPERDPHGDPIPRSDGTIDIPPARPLSEFPTGSEVLIERISDHDPELLQYLAARGVLPGSDLTIGEPEPFSGAVTLTLKGTDTVINLGAAAVEAVFVTPATSAPRR